jgi:hypothetical protein
MPASWRSGRSVSPSGRLLGAAMEAIARRVPQFPLFLWMDETSA